MRVLRGAVAAVVAAGTVGISGAASGAAGHDIVYLATLQHQPATSGYTAFESGSTSSIVVNIRREQHGFRQATVDYTTIATGSASPGTDYTTTSGTMTLDGGTSEDGFEIPILADGSEEGPETFDIELSNPQSQPGDQMILSFPRRATVTIVDDDGPSRISFAAGNYEQFENRGSIALVVIRQGDASAGASAQLDTSDGTATAPDDYTAQSAAPVSFTPGEAGLRVKRISVPVINDSAGEDPESFTAALSNETGAALVSPSTVTVELLDDDSQSSDRTEPVSNFHLPRHGKTYGPNSTPAKEVHISPSDEGSGVADVFLALRKNLRNGKCQWWRGNRFRQSSCNRKKWLDLPYKRTCFDKTNPFCIYQFGRRLQPTTRKTGIRSYTAWARAEDRAGNIEDNFRAGRNKSRYRIKP